MDTHTDAQTHTCTHTHTHMDTHTDAQRHTCTHTQAHTHIHTHMQADADHPSKDIHPQAHRILGVLLLYLAATPPSFEELDLFRDEYSVAETQEEAEERRLRAASVRNEPCNVPIEDYESDSSSSSGSSSSSSCSSADEDGDDDDADNDGVGAGRDRGTTATHATTAVALASDTRVQDEGGNENGEEGGGVE